MKKFCLCAALFAAFVAVSAIYAQEAAACGCPCVPQPACKVVAKPCAPCAVPCYPVAYPYYYPAYRVGLFGCVRPVVAYPYYAYPRWWW